MPHQGRSAQQLLEAGVSDIEAFQHAMQDSGGSATVNTGFTPGVVDPPPGGTGPGGALTLNDLFAFRAAMEDAAEDAALSGPISVFSTSGSKETSASIIDETVTRYLNVQTPEAFLNDWEVAFNAHINGLLATGELSNQDAKLARGQMGTFFQEYIGEIGRRALAGEDPFRAVGLGGDQTVVGSRPGVQSESTSKTKSTAEGTSSQSASQGGETQQTSTTSKDKKEVESSTKVDQTEVIVTRPELDTVFAFSPTDFLNEKFGEGAGRLTTITRSREPQRRPQGTVQGGLSARRT